MTIILGEGLRMFLRSFRVKLKGFYEYEGNAEAICKQIVKECWNGRYFETSRGNYPIFYTRDFSFCASSLQRLGYKKEVEKTLKYALSCFSKKNIASAISVSGKPFDFPVYSPDSLPLFLKSLLDCGQASLAREHEEFFTRQSMIFYKKVIDKKTGLVKNRHLSSIRDYSLGKRSCYNTVMAALLSKQLDKLKFNNPLKNHDYIKQLKELYWNGSYFKNNPKGYVSADANIFPFWTGVINDKKIMKKAFAAMQKNQLDKPFPAKYVKKGIREKMIPQEFFVPGWERNAVWAHLGMIYISMLSQIDRKKAIEHLEEYMKVIEHNKTFIEVYTESGKPYSSFFYNADEGMLWASMFLDLKKFGH